MARGSAKFKGAVEIQRRGYLVMMDHNLDRTNANEEKQGVFWRKRNRVDREKAFVPTCLNLMTEMRVVEA